MTWDQMAGQKPDIGPHNQESEQLVPEVISEFMNDFCSMACFKQYLYSDLSITKRIKLFFFLGARPFSRLNSAVGGRPMTSGRIGSAVGGRVIPGTASRLLESAMQVNKVFVYSKPDYR